MGDKTKIDWCDASWNPVTGCLHGCKYCYARKIAERFGIKPFGHIGNTELNEPIVIADKIEPYPCGFEPTFHRYKLDEPQHWKKPRNIFVCSMADLFGDWVPNEWIEAVFGACEKAPWHRYIFLTKNPKRYVSLAQRGLLPSKENLWYGYSATRQKELISYKEAYEWTGIKMFVSVEPILESMEAGFYSGIPEKWVIVGAETGSRKDKVIPKTEWIKAIATECKNEGVPIFMKESLRGIMDNNFRQEFPWEVQQ